MNENINLIEILRDAPKGITLWSSVCGECWLYNVDIYNDTIKCIVELDSFSILFDSKGRFNGFKGECLLFPSKDNRDWATFKTSWKHKHFEPFQKVLVNICGTWHGDIYSHYVKDIAYEVGNHVTIDGHYCLDNAIIPYDGNEDKLGKPVK